MLTDVTYAKFAGRSRLDKCLNSLLGLIEGISIDALINNAEIEFLASWLQEHEELKDCHPYNELLPVVQKAIVDGIITSEERQDILWLCEKLHSTDFYDGVTADIQRLHAVLGGIVSDGEITETELRGLSVWLQEHDHLAKRWPFEEVSSLVTSVLSDKKIDAGKQAALDAFLVNL